MASSRRLILQYAGDSSPYSAYSSSSSSSTILPSHFSTYLTVASFTFFTLFFCICYRRRCTSRRIDHYRDRGHDRDWASGLGLDPEVVKSFPTVNHKPKHLPAGDGDEKEEEEYCVVCLRHYEEGETLQLLPPCKHLFHQNCIETWLLSHTTCPLCRTNLSNSHHLLMPPQTAAAAITTAASSQPFDPESHAGLGLGSKGEMRRCHSIGHSSCHINIKSALIIRAYSMDLRHSGALHQLVPEEDKGARAIPAHFLDPR